MVVIPLRLDISKGRAPAEGFFDRSVLAVQRAAVGIEGHGHGVPVVVQIQRQPAVRRDGPGLDGLLLVERKVVIGLLYRGDGRVGGPGQGILIRQRVSVVVRVLLMVVDGIGDAALGRQHRRVNGVLRGHHRRVGERGTPAQGVAVRDRCLRRGDGRAPARRLGLQLRPVLFEHRGILHAVVVQLEHQTAVRRDRSSLVGLFRVEREVVIGLCGRGDGRVGGPGQGLRLRGLVGIGPVRVLLIVLHGIGGVAVGSPPGVKRQVARDARVEVIRRFHAAVIVIPTVEGIPGPCGRGRLNDPPAVYALLACRAGQRTLLRIEGHGIAAAGIVELDDGLSVSGDGLPAVGAAVVVDQSRNTQFEAVVHRSLLVGLAVVAVLHRTLAAV